MLEFILTMASLVGILLLVSKLGLSRPPRRNYVEISTHKASDESLGINIAA